jgi:MFS transporter, DHA3 family, macrolide efflux protein
LSLAVGVSAVGDPITLTLSQFLLYRETHAPLALAGIYLSQIAAAILVGLFAGSIADRVDRRSLVATLELGRAVLVALLPVLTLISPLTLYPALFLVGGAEAIVQPARLAGVPGLVGSDQVERASASLLLLSALGQAAGFALAGVLIAVLPEPRVLFLIDAVTFAAAGLLVLSVGSLGGGVTKVKLSGAVFQALASRRLRPHLVLAGGVSLCTAMLAPSLLPLSYQLSGNGVTVYASLQVLLILGATVGSLIAFRTGASAGVLAIAIWLFAIGVLGTGLGHAFWIAGVAIAISAVGNALYFIANQSTLLKAADERSRGSVMSARYSVVQVSRVLGLGAGGTVTSAGSAMLTFTITGILLLVAAAVVSRWWLGATLRRRARPEPAGPSGGQESEVPGAPEPYSADQPSG